MRKNLLFLITLMFLWLPVAGSLAADGDLDTTFNPLGIGGVPPGTVFTNIGGAEQGFATVVQADGKIVVAGITTFGGGFNFALARYNTDGSLDTASFNPGAIGSPAGTVVTNLGGSFDVAFGVAVQPDGKIVVAGYSATPAPAGIAVARYNTDGSLDTTFNSAGVLPGTVITQVNPPLDAFGYAVALQPDGKIVVSGELSSGAASDMLFVRYNLNGTLDTSFNSGGIGGVPAGTAIVNFGGVFQQANSVLIQSDGKIVGTGHTNIGGPFVYRYAAARLNADGTLDSATFNPLGIGGTPPGTVTTSFNGATFNQAYASVLQPDGKIILGGQADSFFGLVRYNSDGTLDTATFNPTGAGGQFPGTVVTNVTGTGTDYIAALVLQPDGKILAGGAGRLPVFLNFLVARYNPDGSLDSTTFNPTGAGGVPPGTVATALSAASDNVIAALALQLDGKIVAVGQTDFGGGGTNFALARYQNSNPLTPTTITFPVNGSFINTPIPMITGTAQNPANVTIFLDGVEQLPGTVTIGTANTWVYTPLAPLTDGAHILVATAVYKSGRVNSVSALYTFTVDTVAPPVPVIITPADGSTINTTTPVISGTASGDAVTVDIAIDGIPVATGVPVVAGAWSYTLTAGQALSQGAHQAEVAALDAAGNRSAVATSNFTVDTLVPTPVIITPASGSTIQDNTPTISGTASGDAVTVDIAIDGVTIATNVPVVAGAWSYTLTALQALSEGAHEVQVIARDALGNSSVPAISDFIVATIIPIPAAPVITQPPNGSVLNTRILTIAGTADANATAVDIFIDGVLVASNVPVINGTWSYTLTSAQALSEGFHSVIAVAINSVGNTSAPSNRVVFEILISRLSQLSAAIRAKYCNFLR